MTVQSLSRSGLGLAMPDTAARLRVAIDSITANLTLSTVTTVSSVTTVGTVSTVTNQQQMGGVFANEHIPSLMRMNANGLRDRIIVT
jgi:type III secretory pathway component EscU